MSFGFCCKYTELKEEEDSQSTQTIHTFMY